MEALTHLAVGTFFGWAVTSIFWVTVFIRDEKKRSTK